MRDSDKPKNKQAGFADHPINKTFGDYIRTLRESKKLGQAEVARRLGLTVDFLNQIESGQSEIPITLLFVAKSLFGGDTAVLLATVQAVSVQTGIENNPRQPGTLLFSVPAKTPISAVVESELTELVSRYSLIDDERRRQSVLRLISDYTEA